ncbi:GNAT family N-acetyltransferase [Nocardia colli]|uniref:GNAT family N-acetyltransferase n=1 Tax=Nocardia colli TaxID=2545717 RepID=A0A5N0EA59_9NOCA|nr:GNAT family N-acetyltransferase [Nocardia colli]KAA8886312.1 GNAT family N-acetyltransferase [Nocardia colli]
MIEPYCAEHLEQVVALCAAEGWPSYPSQPERADAALRSPGAVTLVATSGGAVIGFAHALSDGWWGYLSLLLVADGHRGKGIGGRLVEEIFRCSGVTRLDLVSDEASEFYRSRPHCAFDGFRLYPTPRLDGSGT